MSCISELTKDILVDCDASQGIETNVVLINSKDLDRTASTVTGKEVVINLKSGTKGFKLEGIKQINSYRSTPEINDDSLNKFNHEFDGRIYDLSAETRVEIDALGNGANLIAVVEKKYKGTDNESAFVVLGFQNGLELSEGAENSAENDGAFTFTLASNPLALEPKSPLIYFDTDYDTSLTAFENAFDNTTP